MLVLLSYFWYIVYVGS